MLAAKLGGTFIDGDEHSDQTKVWFASSLSTARSIARTVSEEAARGRAVVVAYPLRCLEWIFYSRRLAEMDLKTIFVSLQSTYDAIADPGRGRSFSADELRRVNEMIDQGYGHRSFSDLFVDTGTVGPDESLQVLFKALKALG